MLQESQKGTATTIGRILLGLLFFGSGVSILTMSGTEGTAMYFKSVGVPLAGLMVWVVLAIKLIAGAALMLGMKVEKAAALLILFTLGTIWFGHWDINDPGLFKNLAVIGGLLYVMTYGPGNGWRLRM